MQEQLQRIQQYAAAILTQVAAIIQVPDEPRIALSGSKTLAEDAASGTNVGALSVINGIGDYTYTITSNPSSKFAIDGSDLDTADTLDFETASSYTVVIQANNGAGSIVNETFVITITNVDEGAPTEEGVIVDLIAPVMEYDDIVALGGEWASWAQAWKTNTDIQSGTTNWAAVNFYDRAAINYWFYWSMRNDNPSQAAIFKSRADALVASYLTEYVIPNNYGIPPHNMFITGIAVDALLNSNATSLTAVGRIADVYASNSHYIYYGSNPEGMDARNSARHFEVLFCAWYCDAPSQLGYNWATKLDEFVAYFMQQQGTTVSGRTVHPGAWRYPVNDNYSKSFMDGVMSEILMRLIEKGPVLPSFSKTQMWNAIKNSVDFLYEHCWRTVEKNFWYIEPPGDQQGNLEEWFPDLNNMIAPSFEYVYFRTGDTDYKDAAEEAFANNSDYTVTAGSLGKQLNERYRYALHLPHYREATPRADVSAGGGIGGTITPSLSGTLGTQTGTTTANIRATTNKSGGNLYYVVTTASNAPSAAQVKAGQNHLGAAAVKSGSTSVTAAQQYLFNITGLTAATQYWAHFMHEDGDATQSAVSSTASFTTASEGAAAEVSITEVAQMTHIFKDGNPHTEAAFNIGSISGTQARILLVDSETTSDISITVGGVAASRLATSARTSNVACSIWLVNGTHDANEDIVFSGAYIGRLGCHSLIIDGVNTTPTETQSDPFAFQGDITLSWTMPSGGIALGVVWHNTFGGENITISGTGATELTNSTGQNLTMVPFKSTGSSITQAGSAFNGSAAVVAVFEPL